MRKIILVIFLLLFSSSMALADDHAVTCSGTITTVLQNAINAAADNDTITIGNGTCTVGAVSFSNKNITVQGGGIGSTNISGMTLNITTTTKAAWRVTGLSLTSSKINVNSQTIATAIKGWRIDHIAFTYPSCTQNVSVQVTGQSWGLIDSCTFNNAGNAIFLTGYTDASGAQGYETSPWPPDGDPGMGGHGWGMALNQGSDEAVYVEDSTFTLAASCYYGVNDLYYGSRMVFRYNTVTNAYWQNHAARSYERGGNLNAEIYNNDFNATDEAWYRAIHIRSGTGVVFNNTIRGYFTTMNVDNQRSDGANVQAPYLACDGTHAWDMNTIGGWPCLDQIGRGSGVAWGADQPSVPLYIWNNGSDAGCHTGGACSNNVEMSNQTVDAAVEEGRDYINNGTTAKPGYSIYTYPHPLRGEQAGDTTDPTITGFTIPATANALTVDVSTFTCTDETALHGTPYCVTTTNSSADCSWGASAPATVTFGASGEQTAYAWCRDAAANVSDATTDAVTITLPASYPRVIGTGAAGNLGVGAAGKLFTN